MKSELRKEVLKSRNALTPTEVAEKSARVIERLLALDEYRQASAIMCYLDFRNEVRTESLILRAMADGKRIAVPVTDIAKRSMASSLLINFPEDIHLGTWGIPEPKPACRHLLDPSWPDMVIVPGVAFDVEGNRLGYGGGFYDRYLPKTRLDSFFVALAFEMQVRPCVYHGQQDVPVHCLLTEEREIRTHDLAR